MELGGRLRPRRNSEEGCFGPAVRRLRTARNEREAAIFHQGRENRPYRNSQRRGPETSPWSASKQGEEISETGTQETLRAGSDWPPFAHPLRESLFGGHSVAFTAERLR